ncbi:MAG: hypothetical protein LR011_00790 [Verrucomicrobia bacterium]|nr:hypothetical protein [Verrucomicrobiota bacterium]
MEHAEIQAPDKHFLSAAQGWLDLGNPTEAELELNRIGYWSRSHPEVMMIRWKLVCRMKKWERSLDVARTMIRTASDRPSGWVCLAYSLCHLDRDIEAKARLIEASARFPTVSAIPYFLARLSVKLEQMEDAVRWFHAWNEMVETDEQRKTARRDPKLKALWAYLGEDLSKFESADESHKPRSEDGNQKVPQAAPHPKSSQNPDPSDPTRQHG